MSVPATIREINVYETNLQIKLIIFTSILEVNKYDANELVYTVTIFKSSIFRVLAVDHSSAVSFFSLAMSQRLRT
ncbi:hypothetical protein D9M69_644280 [compost metagenome]